MKNSRLAFTLSIVATSAIFFVLVGLITLSLSFIRTNSQQYKDGDIMMKTVDYRYHEYNIKTNTSSFGIVSTPAMLGHEDYVSYADEEHNNLVLISSFEMGEYLCHGTCTCENFNIHSERRVKITSVTVGVVLLLAAISPYLAIRKAQSDFIKECKRKFKEDCEDQSVIAYIDRCEKFGVEYDSGGEPENRKDRREMLCQGRCEMRTDLVENEEIEKAEEFRCELLQLHQQIPVTVKVKKGFWRLIRDVMILNDAKIEFHKSFLVPFCKANSEVQIRLLRNVDHVATTSDDDDDDEGKGNQEPKNVVVSKSLCQAPRLEMEDRKDEDDNKIDLNPEIHCLPLE